MSPLSLSGARLSSVLLLVWLVAEPTTALGWTRTQIYGAQAHVDVVDGSAAHVALALRVRITGGWLSELELPAIAVDIVPDADKPPTMIAETGEKFAPELTLRKGVWRVSFPDKRSAPWRGDYTLSLSYRERLATEQVNPGVQRVRWSMPPWRLGMEEPRIWISAPRGSRPTGRTDGTSFGGESVLNLRGRTLITHRRSQLPRDTEWSVAVDVPQAAHDTSGPNRALAVVGDNASARSATPIKVEWLPDAVWLPAWILLLTWWKRRLTLAVARSRRFLARPLIPLSHVGQHATIALVLATFSSLLWSQYRFGAAALLTLLVLLGINRSFDRPAAATLRWSTASGASRRAGYRLRMRSWMAAHAWMDASMPTGAITLAGAYGFMLLVVHLDARQAQSLAILALMITPLWTTATRLHMPWDGARMASVLSRWMQRHREALRESLTESDEALLCLDEQGCARDARLPLRIRHPLRGLSAIDLTLVTDARSLRRSVALLAQALEGSPADVVLRQLPVSAKHSAAGRVVYVVPPEHIIAAVHRLTTPEREHAAATNEIDRAAA